MKDNTFLLKRRREKSLLTISTGLPFFIIMILFIAIPLVFVVVYSFTKDPDAGIFRIELTISNYHKFFGERAYLSLLGQSIYLAIMTTIITILIGFPFAYFMVKQSPRVQTLLLTLITAPMWINMLLRTIALKQLIQATIASLLGTRIAILIGMVYLFLPYMVIPIYTVLQKIDKSLYQAAFDLGANEFKTIIKVAIPLSYPGIYSGILMVLLPAATTLIVPAYLGKRKYLIGNIIEAYAKMSGNIGVASAITITLSFIMLLMMLVLRIGMVKRKRRKENYAI